MTTTSDLTQLPERFDFDLDAWEPDAADLKDDLVVKIGGRGVRFSDPRDKPWQELVALDNPVQFIRVCTSKEDREHIMDQQFTSRKLEALMKRFMEHFEVDEAIAEAQKQSRLRGLS
jgi:hypothetical protein